MSSFAGTNTNPLASLDKQRQSLEAEALGLVSELNSHGDPPVGVSGSLVDSEGFPFPNVDAYRVRSLRNRLAIIKTDHKTLMKKLEQALLLAADSSDKSSEEITSRLAEKPKPKYDNVTGCWCVKNWDGTVAGIENGENIMFADIGREDVDKLRLSALSLNGGSSAPRSAIVPPSTTTTTTNTPTPTPAPTRNAFMVEPFAIFDEVAENSPASIAGLKNGDILLKFGSIHFQNHNNLKAIASTVSEAAQGNMPIVVDILRSGAQMRLSLRPRAWAGRGVLGCRVSPHSP
ncbi:hypothetical protein TrLO_g14264 [Triparma laevis f. longispina]|uniref:Nas2 N-terminal domain-containing protein n=1 Tax=Triparma laevis f. longispina TaxID=1714387 RepID=A0A9W6Z9F4_9STRA|nr:hypothetical protein TrLO_g14264 [Triparma laevis f. longispina]